MTKDFYALRLRDLADRVAALCRTETGHPPVRECTAIAMQMHRLASDISRLRVE